jgi:nucleotidyltransferase/DNA polymerase involved in DNA repair
VRIASVLVSRFPCAVEISRQPQLAKGPLIVGDAEQPKRVLDCCLEAHRRGVRRGMTVRRALGACPDASIVPPDPVLYRSRWQAALTLFGEITPEIEDVELGRAYLNVSGLQSHYRDESELAGRIADVVYAATGIEASVGISSGKLTAFVAAITTVPGEVCVISSGEEKAFLDERSVELLPVDPEISLHLKLLGLSTLGDVARLTIPDLQSQFGFEGERIWHLANGVDETPIYPRPFTEALGASFSFEAPVAGIDVMVAVARQLLSRLRPALSGRAARELILQAELSTGRGWERRLVLREAVSEEERLIFVLRSLLNNFPPPQAIRSLTLRLDGLTAETGKQLSLGDHSRLQRQLEEAIQQLKTRYGYSPVYRCVDVEPWSVIPEERQILVESDG